MVYKIEVWGNTVWNLLHSIIEKIKDDKFILCKNELCEIILLICSNLPCPECATDAKNILSKVNFNSITSKNEMRILMFNFHNHVNRKLNKQEYSLENVTPKYSKANMDAIYSNFFLVFISNSNIPQLMGATFQRQQTFPRIKNGLLNLRKYMD